MHPQNEGKRKGKIFNSSPLTSPPSPPIIYSNKVSIDHFSFLPFPSITFPSLFLPSPSLFQSKQKVINTKENYRGSYQLPHTKKKERDENQTIWNITISYPTLFLTTSNARGFAY